ENGRAADLNDRTGQCDGADRNKILEREMEADAEHQQDDANLGEFQREVLIGHVTGCERPDQNPCEQIAGDRWQLQAMSNRAEEKSNSEAGNEGCDKGGMMHQDDLSCGG